MLTHRLETAGKMLSDPQMLATPLITLLLDTYGTEPLEWDPETISMEIAEDFRITLPRINHDKLMSAILVVTTDRFYKLLPDFITVCNVFSGTPFDPGEFDPADALECAWGITEVLLLDPPEEDDPFTEEIRRYVGKVVEDEGLLDPPDVLKLGIRSQPLPGSDFSEDPVMFQAIWGAEKRKSDDIRQAIRSRLGLLLKQMKALPLREGKTDDLIKQLQRSLPGDGRGQT